MRSREVFYPSVKGWAKKREKKREEESFWVGGRNQPLAVSFSAKGVQQTVLHSIKSFYSSERRTKKTARCPLAFWLPQPDAAARGENV